jgi:hypothetical protein
MSKPKKRLTPEERQAADLSPRLSAATSLGHKSTRSERDAIRQREVAELRAFHGCRMG